MKRLTKSPYVYWVVGIFLAYMALNVLISQFYVTVRYIPYYLDTLNWGELILGAVFSLAIGLLIAINSVYLYIRHKEKKKIAKQEAVTCVATATGLATGICSACVAGIVPLIFSLAGISFSWSVLPFKGLEVQLLVIVILSLNLHHLKKW